MGQSVIVGIQNTIGALTSALHGILVRNFLQERNAQLIPIITTADSWAHATPLVWCVAARNLRTENRRRSVQSGTRILRTTHVRTVALTLSVTARDTCHQAHVFAGTQSIFGLQKTVLLGTQDHSFRQASTARQM